MGRKLLLAVHKEYRQSDTNISTNVIVEKTISHRITIWIRQLLQNFCIEYIEAFIILFFLRISIAKYFYVANEICNGNKVIKKLFFI